MTNLRCTWCDEKIEHGVLWEKGDPFCGFSCLDLQLEEDALFEEAKEVLEDES